MDTADMIQLGLGLIALYSLLWGTWILPSRKWQAKVNTRLTHIEAVIAASAEVGKSLGELNGQVGKIAADLNAHIKLYDYQLGELEKSDGEIRDDLKEKTGVLHGRIDRIKG